MTRTASRPDPPTGSKPPPARPLFGAVLLVAATLLAYVPVWQNGFIWDDDAHVTQNIALRSPLGLMWIWTRPGTTPQYYPFTHTSFWVQWQIWGSQPLPYHLGNVALHAASALILWRIGRLLGLRAALAIALVFAIHPVQVESVAWISERKNTLSGTLYLASGYAGLRAMLRDDRVNVRWWLASTAFFACAILSKTVAGTLPAALLVVLWWKTGRMKPVHLPWLLPMFAGAILMGRGTASMEQWSVGAVGPEFDFTLIERFLIAGRALWFYAWKLAVPYPLMFTYPRWEIDAGQWWQWLFPAGAVGLVAALWLARGWLGRGPAAGAALFGGLLFPALGFVNVYPMRYSWVADHFQYLACIGLIAPACEGAARLLRGEAARWLLASIALLLGLRTFIEAQKFRDSETLWTRTLERNPSAWIAHAQLASIAAREDRLDEAAGRYQTSLQLYPKQTESQIGLAGLLRRVGRDDEALARLRQAVAVAPHRIAPRLALGDSLLRRGQTDEAMEQFHLILESHPGFEPARLQIARIFASREDLAQAELQCHKALEYFPESVAARMLLGELLTRQGRTDEARAVYRQAAGHARALRLPEAQAASIQSRIDALEGRLPATRGTHD